MNKRARSDRRSEVGAVTDAMVQASRALVAVAARSLLVVEGEVTLAQYRALLLLSTAGDQTVGALSAGLGVQPSSATRLCDRLVAKGLVRRAPALDDRREVTVALTPDGSSLVGQVLDARRTELARIVRRIPATRRQGVVEALTDLAGAADGPADDALALGWP